MVLKNKKTLPTRPGPPSVDQIIEDIKRASPNDPVFSILQDANQDGKGGSSKSEVEAKYLQSRRYLELNKRLQKAREDLVRQREELQAVGETLEHRVAEVKGRAL